MIWSGSTWSVGSFNFFMTQPSLFHKSMKLLQLFAITRKGKNQRNSLRRLKKIKKKKEQNNLNQSSNLNPKKVIKNHQKKRNRHWRKNRPRPRKKRKQNLFDLKKKWSLSRKSWRIVLQNQRKLNNYQIKSQRVDRKRWASSKALKNQTFIKKRWIIRSKRRRQQSEWKTQTVNNS